MTRAQFIAEIRDIIRRNYRNETPERIGREVREAARKFDYDLQLARLIQREAERQELDAFVALNLLAVDTATAVKSAGAYPDEIAALVARGEREGWSQEELFKRINRHTEMQEHHLRTAERTITAAIARIVTIQSAIELGNPNLLYAGPNAANTRQFCRIRLGQIKTLQEWQADTNEFGQSVAVHCGGYNCRHRLVVID